MFAIPPKADITRAFMSTCPGTRVRGASYLRRSLPCPCPGSPRDFSWTDSFIALPSTPRTAISREASNSSNLCCEAANTVGTRDECKRDHLGTAGPKASNSQQKRPFRESMVNGSLTEVALTFGKCAFCAL